MSLKAYRPGKLPLACDDGHVLAVVGTYKQSRRYISRRTGHVNVYVWERCGLCWRDYQQRYHKPQIRCLSVEWSDLRAAWRAMEGEA